MSLKGSVRGATIVELQISQETFNFEQAISYITYSGLWAYAEFGWGTKIYFLVFSICIMRLH